MDLDSETFSQIWRVF